MCSKILSHNFKIKYLNYFDMLPCEILTYIYIIRNNNCANTIINQWYRFIGKKIVATQLMISLIKTKDIYNDNECNDSKYNIYCINLSIPITTHIIEYCNKVLTGKENDWWITQLNLIRTALLLQTDMIDPKLIYYYYRTKIALNELFLKFEILTM